MITANIIRPALRCLALASVAVLAACQQTMPKRSGTEPAPARPAAAHQQTQQRQAVAGTPPVVTFHLAQVRQADGLAKVQLNADTSVYAAPQPVFTQADLRQVVPVQTKEGRVFLRFDFNEQGAAKLARVTREARGHYLIISIRGKLVAVPLISAAYDRGSFPLQVQNAEEAQAIMQMMR